MTPPQDLGPLDGLTIIDLTTSYAGPTASIYLADRRSGELRWSGLGSARTPGRGARRSHTGRPPGLRAPSGTNDRWC
jgi:hypothetical protein